MDRTKYPGYEGVIVRVAYIAHKAENDHVEAVLVDGKRVDCFRFQVKEVQDRSNFPRI